MQTQLVRKYNLRVNTIYTKTKFYLNKKNIVLLMLPTVTTQSGPC